MMSGRRTIFGGFLSLTTFLFISQVWLKGVFPRCLQKITMNAYG
jgi:hypothetical protein